MAKKILTFVLAIGMLLSLAACGGEETPPTDNPKATEQNTQPTETTAPMETEPATQLTVHENTFFTVAYSEEDGWSLAEDDYGIYDNGGDAYVRILDEEGYTDIVVTIRAEEEDASAFRKALYVNGIDQMAYANGEIETTDVGGQAMLHVDQRNGDRFYFGRNEAAGVYYTIDATDWEDPRVPALVENITFKTPDNGNVDAPWPWEGEPFSAETKSEMVGTFTVTAQQLPLSESLVTYDIFKQNVEVIGDKVYLMSNYVLREYTLENNGLTFNREIPLEEDYEFVESADGNIVLSNHMKPVLGHDGENVVYSYDGPAKFSVAPDGTWGISWFYSGDTCQKYTFRDGALVAEEFPFNEVKSMNTVCIDDRYILISGTPAEGSGHRVFVYDHSGVLQMELLSDPEATIGLGCITYVIRTANGFLGLDGNMRDVVLWTADGTWLGAIDASDLFSTGYPWISTADVMSDGSILVVMTQEREDKSGDEVIAFRLSGF